jgi:hypothetical protein
MNPETAEDRLIMEAYSIAKRGGKEKELYESFRMVVQSMEFDAKRIQDFKRSKTYTFPEEASLRQHYYDLDIV